MFKVNEIVVYGNEGTCLVEKISMLDMPNVDKNKPYYVLKPLYHEGVIYSPVDTKVFMRPVISYEAVQQIIDQIPDLQVDIFNNSNFRELGNHYKSLIQSYNCENLIKIIKAVNIKKSNALNSGKRIGQTDENYMRVAEDLLFGEFAAALNIPKENVKSYIEKRVEEQEEKIN